MCLDTLGEHGMHTDIKALRCQLNNKNQVSPKYNGCVGVY